MYCRKNCSNLQVEILIKKGIRYTVWSAVVDTLLLWIRINGLELMD
ncbi:MAG: hypothetical protein RR396_02135 [Clostridiales bacterium]